MTFRVDADGILEVSAVEQQTGARSEVVVKPAFGLDERDITDMLKASYEFAAEDMVAQEAGRSRCRSRGVARGLRVPWHKMAICWTARNADIAATRCGD